MPLLVSDASMTSHKHLRLVRTVFSCSTGCKGIASCAGRSCDKPGFVPVCGPCIPVRSIGAWCGQRHHLGAYTSLHGAAFAYATAALSPTLDIANAVLLTLPTALLFAAGYLLRWRDIPRYWIWFGYLNWCGPSLPGTGLSPIPVHSKHMPASCHAPLFCPAGCLLLQAWCTQEDN